MIDRKVTHEKRKNLRFSLLRVKSKYDCYILSSCNIFVIVQTYEE